MQGQCSLPGETAVAESSSWLRSGRKRIASTASTAPALALREALRRPGRDLIEGAQGVGAGIDPSRAEEMVDKFREGGLLVVRAGGRGGHGGGRCGRRGDG